MSYAAEASAEIDRLIWALNGRLWPKHEGKLRALARDVGLDSLDLLPQFAGFLLDGLLTDEVAKLRMRYADPGKVTARLAELRGASAGRLNAVVGSASRTLATRFSAARRASEYARLLEGECS